MAQSALLLNGKLTAEKIIAQISQELTKSNHPPITLATVLVGNYPPSRLYVGLKLKMAQRAGLKTRLFELPEDAEHKQVEDTLRSLANDSSINGILVQLPLPKHLDKNKLITLIPPNKDVDGLTAQNLGNLLNNYHGLIPCTPLGVMELIKEYDIETQGKQAVIVGRSSLVSLPLAILLSRKGIDCTVTICHSKTKDLPALCRTADILISACGIPRLIKADFVKPKAVVFDVGVTRKDDKIYGDVDFDAVSDIASAITPMPNGTGPMTVACLIKNTLLAAQMQ